MSLRIPSWALWALAGVLAAAASAGLALESRPWADDHPFSLNVLSALTGFAASGLFAALVLDRARRARYSAVELNRRTHALTEVDALLRSLVLAFGSSSRSPSPVAALTAHAQDIARSSVPENDRAAGALVDRLREAESHLLTPEGYPDGHRLAAGFAFLADSRIEFLAERLDRKARALRLALSALHAAPPGGRSAAEAYEWAADLAAAASELRTWLYDAPSRAMRRAVERLAYLSDVDD